MTPPIFAPAVSTPHPPLPASCPGAPAIRGRACPRWSGLPPFPNFFSGAFLGALAAGVLKSLEIIKRDKWRHIECWKNAEYLKSKLKEAGFNTLNTQTPIIPVFIGDEKTAINMSEDLLDKGILSPPFRWPAVPRGEARMRLTATCDHSKEQLDRLIESLTVLGKKYRIVN